MKEITQFFIKESTTIKEALMIIDKGAIRIALVVTHTNKLLGTLSDGDIRRALLNNITLDSSIKEIYSKKPIFAFERDSKDSIIQKAITNQVYQIPIVNNNHIVVDIINLASLLNITKKRNRVILMAGGLGSRLRPLTQNIPKPLLKVGNKPILETIIKSFASYGFVNFTISVNYKSEMIKKHFKDGKDFGVNIEYVEENKRLGTAGALSLLEDIPKEPFFGNECGFINRYKFFSFIRFS